MSDIVFVGTFHITILPTFVLKDLAKPKHHFRFFTVSQQLQILN